MATFRSRIEDFESYLHHERGASVHTRSAYARDLRSFAEHLEETQLGAESTFDPEQVGVYEIRGYLGSLHGKVKTSTISRKLSALRSFYKFLTSRGHCMRNPMLLIDRPKARPPLPNFLPVDEAIGLMERPRNDDALGLRDRAILEVLYGAGLRVSELTGLDLAQVDLESGLLRVLGKGNKERIVPCGRMAVSAIRDYLPARAELAGDACLVGMEALFLSRLGRRISRRRVQQIVDAEAIAAGVKGRTSPHDLRHSCATHLLDSGADLRSIQEILGHSSLSTTQRYTHLTVDGLIATHEQFHPLERKGED